MRTLLVSVLALAACNSQSVFPNDIYTADNDTVVSHGMWQTKVFVPAGNYTFFAQGGYPAKGESGFLECAAETYTDAGQDIVGADQGYSDLCAFGVVFAQPTTVWFTFKNGFSETHSYSVRIIKSRHQ